MQVRSRNGKKKVYGQHFEGKSKKPDIIFCRLCNTDQRGVGGWEVSTLKKRKKKKNSMHALHSPGSYTEHLYHSFELSLKLRTLAWYVSLNWNSCDNFGQWPGNKAKIKTGMLNWVYCWPEQGKFSQHTGVRFCGISYQSVRGKVKENCKLACKWVQAQGNIPWEYHVPSQGKGVTYKA